MTRFVSIISVFLVTGLLTILCFSSGRYLYKLPRQMIGAMQKLVQRIYLLFKITCHSSFLYKPNKVVPIYDKEVCSTSDPTSCCCTCAIGFLFVSCRAMACLPNPVLQYIPRSLSKTYSIRTNVLDFLQVVTCYHAGDTL